MDSPRSETVAPPPALELSQWFADEVQPHEPALRAYLWGSFPAVRDVDDVVQESFLRIWRRQMARPVGSARAFLFTVARHLALKIVRKNGNAPFLPGAEGAALRVLDQRPDAAESASVQEKIDRLADAVMALPPRCREIVILHKLQELPQKEVAERLGLSARTVERQIRIGVDRCHDLLRRQGFGSSYGDET